MASEPGTVSSRTPNYNCLYNIRMFCPPESVQFDAQILSFSPNQIPHNKPTLLMPGRWLIGNEHTDWETGETPKAALVPSNMASTDPWRCGMCHLQGTHCNWHRWFKNICVQLNCKYICCLLYIEINMHISMASMYKCIWIRVIAGIVPGLLLLQFWHFVVSAQPCTTQPRLLTLW